MTRPDRLQRLASILDTMPRIAIWRKRPQTGVDLDWLGRNLQSLHPAHPEIGEALRHLMALGAKVYV